MFSKPTRPSAPQRIDGSTTVMAASPQESARKPRVASLISADITLNGDVVGDGELQVDGIIKGDIQVAKLTIGDTGHVEGTITSDVVEVRGRVVGAITAKQVRLHGTAYVDGDITHEQLAMETGAFFQGRSLKFNRAASQPPPVALAAPTPAQSAASDTP